MLLIAAVGNMRLDASQGKDKTREYEFVNKQVLKRDAGSTGMRSASWAGEAGTGNEREDSDV